MAILIITTKETYSKEEMWKILSLIPSCMELSACSESILSQFEARLQFSTSYDSVVQGDHGPRPTAALAESILDLK